MEYETFKNMYQNEVNNLPLKFAFSDEQFKQGMKELGLNENDKSNVVSIGGGGFCTEEVAEKLDEIIDRREKEYKHLLYNDDIFAESAFYYELGNHEYCITYDVSETLEALDLTKKEVLENDRLLKIFTKAKNKYLKDMEKWGY